MDHKEKEEGARRKAQGVRRKTVLWPRFTFHVSRFTFHVSLPSLFFPLVLFLSLTLRAHALMPFSLQFGGKGRAPGQFGAEVYLDVDEAGRIFVSDTGNKRVQIFDSDGTLLHLIASVSEAISSEKLVLSEVEGEGFRFEEPRAIAVARNGRFFVADWRPVPVDAVKDQPLYFYTPIVHRFDAVVDKDTTSILHRLEYLGFGYIQPTVTRPLNI